MKALSDTRWSSRAVATDCLVDNFPQIVDALEECAAIAEASGSSNDLIIANQMRGIVRKMCTFQFILAAVIWKDILASINKVSKYLQSATMELSKALAQIGVIKRHFENLRRSEAPEDGSAVPYDIYVAQAMDLANEMEVPDEFPAPEQVRTRRVPQNSQCEARDDPIRDPADRFRSQFYYYILDISISALGERFDALRDVEKHYGFLYHINDMGFKPSLEQCKLLAEKLRDPTTGISDISGGDLFEEITMYASTSSEASNGVFSPIGFLNSLCSRGIMELFPNLVIALRVLSTIPVGVATAERSFSKLKLIKSYLRNSMSDHRLSSLALISIEDDCLAAVTQADIVSRFSAMCARRVDLSD